MLCLKAEALGHAEMYNSSSHGVILPVNLGRSIHRVMHKVGKGHGGHRARAEEASSSSLRSDPSSSSSASVDGSAASCSVLEDDKRTGGVRGGRRRKIRTQLEQEVQRLQRQLQEEIDLHMALANAVAHNAIPLFDSASKLPDKAQELLDNIAELEITVSKLEDELVSLHLQLCHERNERCVTEDHSGCSPSPLPEAPSSSTGCMWEEHISCLRLSKFGLNQMDRSSQLNQLPACEELQLSVDNKAPDRRHEEEILTLGSCVICKEGKSLNTSLVQPDAVELKSCLKMDLLQCPNQLSEEMVRCMRNIFLCLSESLDISKAPSEFSPMQFSPQEHLSSSSTSFSDSSIMPSKFQIRTRRNQRDEVADQFDSFDPYGVNRKVIWGDIGSYCFAAEVSWMSVGKAQLDYAAEALKRFRFLVEQLAKVNPASMSGNEKLAFWINVYNALIMHAYLAYGVPKSDIKLFSLMQKASYTVGGQSFNAAEIEFVILKMKPPAHRPQLALILALHKFKISDEHRKYAIDSPEPLSIFALSCGMFSSPGVKIFTAKNVQDELRNSMRDYIRASIGISDKGKLLVPKLLHSFAKGVVEDSLLVDWICRYLSPDQVTIVRDSTSQRKQRLLGVRSVSVIPFDSRFRYLFLPDNETKQRFSKDQIVSS